MLYCNIRVQTEIFRSEHPHAMLKNYLITTLFSLLFFFSFTPTGTASSLNVLVTIKPLHSLVAAVMQGAGRPVLLLDSTQSIHHVNLRPSDYEKLSRATIVFWGGPALETFLPAIKKRYEKKAEFIALMQAKGVHLLPARRQNTPPPDNSERNKKKPGLSASTDPHFWLSTYNAAQIVKAVSKKLITADPEHAAIYRSNRNKTLRRIATLQQMLARKLQHINTPFITYHDAYQYFEKEYHLNRLASVSLNETAPPGIKQVRYIKNLLKSRHVHCLFYEAPIRPPVIQTLVGGTRGIQVIELDAPGIMLKPGPALWFDTLTHLGNHFTQCLKRS